VVILYRWESTNLTRGAVLTELDELQVTPVTTIEEALALIDKGLGGLTERQLVSASEVADLLLDVRSLLSDSVLES
jgi:hypothetical protein